MYFAYNYPVKIYHNIQKYFVLINLLYFLERTPCVQTQVHGFMHQRGGSNPGHDTCVLEQDTKTIIAFNHLGVDGSCD